MGAILPALIPFIIQLLQDVPGEVAAIEDLWKFATSKAPATPEQKAQIDAALEEAHATFQKS